MSTIAAVNFAAYRVARNRPIMNGSHTYAETCMAVLELQTDDGHAGVALLPDPIIPGGEDVYRAFVDTFTPLVVGQEADCVERIWTSLWRPKITGRRGYETRVLSAFDIALWDLRCKEAGKSLSVMLGGYADSAPYYVATGYYGSDDDRADVEAFVARALTYDPWGLKMKIGARSVEVDVERVRLARSLLPAGVRLMVDANGAYRAHEAVVVARSIEPFDIAWFEEPVQPDDYEGYARVAAASSVPVAGGENEYTLFGFRDLIQRGKVSVVNIDAQVAGGISEFMKVAAVAEAHGVVVAPHGSQHIHLPLVCGIRNGLVVEYYDETVDPLATVGLHDGFTRTAGRLRPDPRPGVGLQVDHEALLRHTTGST